MKNPGKYLGWGILISAIVFSAMLLVATKTRASEYSVIADLTACETVEAMQKYTEEAYWKRRNTQQVREELGGKCLRAVMIFDEGEVAKRLYFEGVTFDIIRIAIFADSTGGKYDGAKYMYAMMYYRENVKDA